VLASFVPQAEGCWGVTPAARMSCRTSLRFAAKASALPLIAATAAPLPFPARRSAAAPLGSQSFMPRAVEPGWRHVSFRVQCCRFRA
jgi:hypothetical protein